MRGRVVRATSIVLVSLAPLVAGEEPVDHEIINLIRYEGFHNSQVLEIARALTEEIGPRLTGSPRLKQANEWTRDKPGELGTGRRPFGVLVADGRSRRRASIWSARPSSRFWRSPKLGHRQRQAWCAARRCASRSSTIQKIKIPGNGPCRIKGDEPDDGRRETADFGRSKLRNSSFCGPQDHGA